MRGGHLILFTAAAAIRLALSPFFGHSWDMYIWLQSGDLTARGVNIYELKELTDFPWGFYSYPPLWLYWLTLAHYIGGSLEQQVAIIKFPIILSDMLSAWMLYRLARHYGLGDGRSALLSLLFLLNPLTIFISAVWGMFDSIAVLFTLTSFYLLLKGRIMVSGFFLGLGAAAKIFPIFLLIPLAIYLRKFKEQGWRRISTYIGFIILGLALPTLPYLTSLRQIIEKLAFHLTNIGQFTYWVAVSHFLQPSIIGPISLIAFSILVFFTLRKALVEKTDGKSFLLLSVTGVLLAFLASSTKVNVQYTLWVLPFIILLLEIKRDKEMAVNLLILNILAIAFVIAGQVSLALFDLRNLGRITPQRESPLTSLASLVIVASGVTAGTRFAALFTNLLKLSTTSYWNPSRVAVIGVVVILVISLSIFPSPKGLLLPYSYVRVGVMEGIESVFSLEGDMGLGLLRSKFDVTHVVIPVSPELINSPEENDFSKNSRFRISNQPWTKDDVSRLVNNLHGSGVKALLGVYLKSHYHSIHFGYHGYNSTWLTLEHRTLTDEDGNIYFQYLIPGTNTTYAEYFAKNAVRVLEEIGFDGLYLMGVDWSREDVLESMTYLMRGLKQHAGGYTVFLELDPYYLTQSSELAELFDHPDYIVLKTDPWVRRVKNNPIGNYTISIFRNLIIEYVTMSSNRHARVLYGVYMIDIVEGWLTPAVDIQVQVDQYSSILGVEGYALYNINRYLPYRVNVEKPSASYSS